MVLLESKTPQSSMKLPNFSLQSVATQKQITQDQAMGEHGLVVAFVCNHCPYVKHIWAPLVDRAHEFISKGVGFIAISSNDPEYNSEDSPENMKKLLEDSNAKFDYLFDQDQSVAKAFDAVCTPEFFVFDKNKKLYYSGRFDGSSPGNTVSPTGDELAEVVDNLVASKACPEEVYPSQGCSIKWKS